MFFTQAQEKARAPMRHMRFPASIVAAGLALTSAGACGAGDPPPRPGYTSIARSRTHAVAPLLTIRKADLPEFKVTAHVAAAPEGPRNAHETNCVRVAIRKSERGRHAIAAVHTSKLAPVRAHVRSTWQQPLASARSEHLFANGGYQTLGAFSYVSIMPTPVAAQSGITEAKDLDQTCMEHALRGSLAKAHSRLAVRGVAVEPLSMGVKGADESAAYRIVVGYRGAPLVLYMDLIFFSYGQDLMTLTTYHASKPVPPAMDERLLSLLVARAKSHSR